MDGWSLAGIGGMRCTRWCGSIRDGDGQCAVSITPRAKSSVEVKEDHVTVLSKRADRSGGTFGPHRRGLLRGGTAPRLLPPVAQDLRVVSERHRQSRLRSPARRGRRGGDEARAGSRQLAYSAAHVVAYNDVH